MTRSAMPRTRIQRAGADRARRIRGQLADEVRTAREDAGLSLRRLAAAAGVSHGSLVALERGRHDPSTEVLARVSAALGMDLSVRLYPNAGPLIRDHVQSAMLSALIDALHPRWRPHPEIAVRRPVRGVIDLVLEADAPPLVAIEAHSDLRRVEQQIRWGRAKAAALEETRGAPVSQLLVLRATRRLRAIAVEYEPLLAAAYPVPAAAAYHALRGEAPWPGSAVLWCRYEQGRARLLDAAPRRVHLGR